MKCRKSIILTVLLLTVIVGGGAYLYSRPNTEMPILVPVESKPADLWDERPNGEPVVPTNITSDATGTLSYYIPEMGVRFDYPASATVTARTIEGTAGKKIVGEIFLPTDEHAPQRGVIISFGGMTENFSLPKGCDQFCGIGGFSKIGSAYFYGKSGAEGGLITMPERVLTKDGVTEALMIMPSGNEGPGELAPGTAEVIVNTKNTDFPGLSFIGSIKTLEDRALFESIIKSIELY